MLSKSNKEQLKSQGKDIKKIERQVENFIEGFPYMQVDRPAKIKDGIIQLSETALKRAVDFYDDTLGEYKILKFVPASGAASRMFKDLFSFMNEYTGSTEDNRKLNEEGSWNSIRNFFENIQQFAFYEDLKTSVLKDGLDLSELISSGKQHVVLQYLLTEKGLNYGNSPKGLLKFHKYEEGSRTPVEEHLVEGALYARSSAKETNLHFTVSPEHENKFREHIDNVIDNYSSGFKTNFDISFSAQKPSTDTIAVDLDNNPFVLDEGKILHL
jgi:hypothetical protein